MVSCRNHWLSIGNRTLPETARSLLAHLLQSSPSSSFLPRCTPKTEYTESNEVENTKAYIQTAHIYKVVNCSIENAAVVILIAIKGQG